MRSLLLLVLLGFGVTATCNAQTKDTDKDLNQILKLVNNYYSVKDLLSANTIRMEEDHRVFYEEYEYGADFHELTAQRRHFVFDFKNKRISSEFLTQIGSSQFHALFVINNGQQSILDFGNRTLRNMGEQSFGAEARSRMRASDVLLARELFVRKNDVTLLGKEMWLGVWQHHVVLKDADEGPEMTILIDVNTGRITKMSRLVGDRTLVSYTYDRHVERNGLRFASEYSVHANGELLILSIDRNYVLNAIYDKTAFQAVAGTRPEPQRVDQTQMTVEKIANNIFHVGQNESYSTIFDRPSGLVVFGAQAGLKERLNAYKNATDITKEVSTIVAADHHWQKLAGLSEEVNTEVKIMVTKGAFKRLSEGMLTESQLGSIESVRYDQEFDGLFLLSFPSAHSEQNLAIYDPESGVLAHIYHYGNPYQKEPFFAVALAGTLYDALEQRNLVPSTILSNGYRKPVSYSEFKQAVKNYNGNVCAPARRICNGFIP